MRYPGGKGKTYQHVVNLMPPHSVYIETHLGGGAVLRHKRPSARSIAIDADERVIEMWQASLNGRAELVHGRAEDFLAAYSFEGDELIYCDPPYHPATRRQARVYRHDYSEADHVALLDILIKLPCKILLSGYAHPLYEEMLQGWGCKKFEAATHKGNREESLWFNFAPPSRLHDARFLGSNFRDRQSTKRRLQRLKTKVSTMDPVERVAFVQWLHERYPFEHGALV